MLAGEGATAAPCGAVEHPDAKLLELLAEIEGANARRTDFGHRSDVAYAEQYRSPAYTQAMLWRPADCFSIWTDTRRLDSTIVEGGERFLYDSAGVLPALRETLARWRCMTYRDRRWSSLPRDLIMRPICV